MSLSFGSFSFLLVQRSCSGNGWRRNRPEPYGRGDRLRGLDYLLYINRNPGGICLRYRCALRSFGESKSMIVKIKMGMQIYDQGVGEPGLHRSGDAIKKQKLSPSVLQHIHFLHVKSAGVKERELAD
jgi:hypothetical protein